MKKSLVLLFFLCAGIVFGSLVAKLSANVSGLSWLTYGLSFGITSPLVIDLAIVTFTFGATFDLNISVIIFVIVSVAVGLIVSKKTR